MRHTKNALRFVLLAHGCRCRNSFDGVALFLVAVGLLNCAQTLGLFF